MPEGLINILKPYLDYYPENLYPQSRLSEKYFYFPE